MTEETLNNDLPEIGVSESDEARDLGFGSVVAGQSRERLLNPDGSFNVERTGVSKTKAEQALTVNLPPHVTSFRVPAAFMRPGSEFQVGVHTIADNGNIVAVESAFTTAE